VIGDNVIRIIACIVTLPWLLASTTSGAWDEEAGD
jgi:hypothetical protein